MFNAAKSVPSYSFPKRFGWLCFVFRVYGVSEKISTLDKILSKILNIFIHCTPIYIACLYLELYLETSISETVVLGYLLSGVFPLPLHRSLKSKKNSLQGLLARYEVIDDLLGRNSKNHRGALINFLILSSFIGSISSALAYSLNNSAAVPFKKYFSFYINFDEDVLGIFVSVLIPQFLSAYNYAYPCIISIICGALYCELSHFMSRFHKILEKLLLTFNTNELKSEMKIHASILELAHDLENSISLTCFSLLCAHMANMFCLLCVFIEKETENNYVKSIAEYLSAFALFPLAVIGIVLTASRINTQSQKIQNLLLLLKHKLLTDYAEDTEALRCIDIMKEKQFPPMTAYGIVELTPKFAFGIFGSFFTYGLLILNLK